MASPPITSPPPSFAVAKPEEYNRIGIDFRKPLPRPKVRGNVIDFHNHLLSAGHAEPWLDAAKHYGMDRFVTMTPLEEAVRIQRNHPGLFHFIAVPQWGPIDYDDWRRRLDAFHNLGSRMAKFHMAPGTMQMRGYSFDSPQIRMILKHTLDLGMMIMSHLGDPETWYTGKYTDTAKYGTRDQHYAQWIEALQLAGDRTWVGAHMGGNPEDLHRLQELLDRFPNLSLDCSATRWMVREISARRDQAREFFIRNQDRIIYGSDQVSYADRGFDFLASRWWCHRKLWETAYIGPSPIIDPDVPADEQPTLRGLALPDGVLQKLYRDNAMKLLTKANLTFADDPTA